MANKPGVGFIGSGFVTKFHLRAWRGVRDADVLGIYSPFRTRSDRTVMTAYMSAEQERTIPFKPEGLDTFVPLVAQGKWNAR